MLSEIGKPIDLAVNLKRNRFPLSGQTISVKVLDISGAELLAETTIPETSEPGFYSFLWNDPPTTKQIIFAEYVVRTRCYTEEIELVTFGASSSGGSSASVQVSNNVVGVAVESEKTTVAAQGNGVTAHSSEKSFAVAVENNQSVNAQVED